MEGFVSYSRKAWHRAQSTAGRHSFTPRLHLNCALQKHAAGAEVVSREQQGPKSLPAGLFSFTPPHLPLPGLLREDWLPPTTGPLHMPFPQTGTQFPVRLGQPPLLCWVDAACFPTSALSSLLQESLTGSGCLLLFCTRTSLSHRPSCHSSGLSLYIYLHLRDSLIDVHTRAPDCQLQQDSTWAAAVHRRVPCA